LLTARHKKITLGGCGDSFYLEKSMKKKSEPVGEQLLGNRFGSPHQQLRRTATTVDASVYELGKKRL